MVSGCSLVPLPPARIIPFIGKICEAAIYSKAPKSKIRNNSIDLNFQKLYTMRNLLAFAFFYVLSVVGSFAQTIEFKGKLDFDWLVPGRSRILITLHDELGERTDTLVFPKDSVVAFNKKVKGLVYVNMQSYSNQDNGNIFTMMIQPNEKVMYGVADDELPKGWINSDIPQDRLNDISFVFGAFSQLEFDYNYSLADTIVFKELLNSCADSAQLIIDSSINLNNTVMRNAARQLLQLQMADISLMYAFLRRFQEKEKTETQVDAVFWKQYTVGLQGPLQWRAASEWQSRIKRREFYLDSIGNNQNRINPAEDLNDWNAVKGLVSIYPKSDGPECTYGYSGTILWPNIDLSNVREGWFIAPQFDKAMEFSSEGLAIVQQRGLFKLINHQGKNVLDKEFEVLEKHAEGYYLAKYNGNFGVIDSKGQTVLPFQYELLATLDSGLLRFKPSGTRLCGMIALDGKVIMQPRYHSIEPFFGRQITESIMYDEKRLVRNVERQKVPAAKNGIVTREGKEIIAPGWYDFISQEHDAITPFPLVRTERKYHRMFKFFSKGKQDLLFEDGKILAMPSSHPKLNMPGTHYYFTSNNHETVLRSYANPKLSIPFKYGVGFVNAMGNDYFIIPVKNNNAKQSSRNLIITYLPGRYNNPVLLYDGPGPIKTDTFESIEPLNSFAIHDDYSLESSRHYLVEKNYCKGVIKTDGKFLFEPIYDEILMIDTFLILTRNNKCALYDTTGKAYTGFDYNEIGLYEYLPDVLKFKSNTEITLTNRVLQPLFKGPAMQVLPTHNDTFICNWYYINEGKFYLYDREKHSLLANGELQLIEIQHLNNGSEKHLINGKGEWLGVLLGNEKPGKAFAYTVKRGDENLVVTADNKEVLKGRYRNIEAFYQSANGYFIETGSESSGPKLGYRLETMNGYQGVTDTAFKLIADTIYDGLEISPSYIAASSRNKQRNTTVFNFKGDSLYSLESGRRGVGIDLNRYLYTRNIWNSRTYYEAASGKKLAKFNKGELSLTHLNTLYLKDMRKKEFYFLDSTLKPLKDSRYEFRQDPIFGIAIGTRKGMNHLVNMQGQSLASWSQKRGGLPYKVDLYKWADTSDLINKLHEKVFSQSFWNVPAERNFFLAMILLEPSGSSFWRESAGQNYGTMKFNGGYYEGGKMMKTFWSRNDTLYSFFPYANMYEDDMRALARDLARRITSENAINWDVCVKPENLFSFLNPGFELTDKGMRIHVVSLTVQNSTTDDLVVEFSKEEFVRYLRPETSFNQWFKSR